VQAQLESALDLVVQVGRGGDGARRVVAVAEVIQLGAVPAAPTGARGEPSARTRVVADAGGVRRLPSRPPRAPSSGPADPGWVMP
ncbi:MAG: CpaF/VirB11 family protein, partial [Actinomycetota bacterium]|nr:CpaF/VirB11 family protein [Actinomycetota bacterium]